MWKKNSRSKYGCAPNLNHTGMKLGRFEALLSCIRFSEQPAVRVYGMSDEEYRWGLVDKFVMAFNIHREQNFSPGGVICVDESMVRWYGLGGSWISIGLPHFVAMERKPEDGCEIQDACCGVTGIMCRLAIVKTAEASSNQEDTMTPAASPNKQPNDNSNKKASKNSSNPAGTQTVLSLVKPWYDTGRIVVGDSAFASVNTCVQLNKNRLGFIGVVKQATKYFPIEPLSRTIMPHKGQYAGMSTIVDNHTIMSYVWSDRDRRYFVASAGSLAAGKPYTRVRWK